MRPVVSQSRDGSVLGGYMASARYLSVGPMYAPGTRSETAEWHEAVYDASSIGQHSNEVPRRCFGISANSEHPRLKLSVQALRGSHGER